MKRIPGALRRFYRRGPSYIVYLLGGVLAPRIARALLRKVESHRRSRQWLLGAGCLTVTSLVGLRLDGLPGAVAGAGVIAAFWLVVVLLRKRLLDLEVRRVLQEDRRTMGGSTTLDDLPLDPTTRKRIASAECQRGSALLLGELDNDGRLRPQLGAIPGFPSVSPQDFVPRYRFGLSLIARDNELLIRKDYRGDRQSSRNEAACLARLEGTGVAPALRALDHRNRTLEKSLVFGPTLRDLMVEAGARILSVDTDQEEELLQQDSASRLAVVWERGQKVLGQIETSSRFNVPRDLVQAIENALNTLHKQGVTGPSLTFGNIVVRQPDGRPVFIDFDSAKVHRHSRGATFDLARDRDRQSFNRIFGSAILTEDSVHRALAGILSTPYSPLDLGRGLVTRGFWSVDSGTGRWEFLNRDALSDLIQGRRILDLGTHNGALSLMMLREGARSVVAVERDEKMVGAAKVLHRILEWRDLRCYDFVVRCSDMRDILDEDWGEFDLVTSFCSLYYLPVDDMRRVMERAVLLAPTVVLQAKIDTRADAADNKATKSSLEFLTELAATAGFTDFSVHTKPGFSRPILIASRGQSTVVDASP